MTCSWMGSKNNQFKFKKIDNKMNFEISHENKSDIYGIEIGQGFSMPQKP